MPSTWQPSGRQYGVDIEGDNIQIDLAGDRNLFGGNPPLIALRVGSINKVPLLVVVLASDQLEGTEPTSSKVVSPDQAEYAADL